MAALSVTKDELSLDEVNDDDDEKKQVRERSLMGIDTVITWVDWRDVLVGFSLTQFESVFGSDSYFSTLIRQCEHGEDCKNGITVIEMPTGSALQPVEMKMLALSLDDARVLASIDDIDWFQHYESKNDTDPKLRSLSNILCLPKRALSDWRKRGFELIADYEKK